MSERPFHHGNLPAVLLTQAEQTLREQGIDALSLRDLARQAGVSHGAPRRHFPDRQALLDALATQGFTRLTEQIHAAIADAGQDYGARLRAGASAYVRFATDSPALLDLMFAARSTTPPPTLSEASARFFVTIGDVLNEGQQAGTLPSGSPENLRLLIVSTLHGIAALVVSGKLPAVQTDTLIADAIALFHRP